MKLSLRLLYPKERLRDQSSSSTRILHFSSTILNYLELTKSSSFSWNGELHKLSFLKLYLDFTRFHFNETATNLQALLVFHKVSHPSSNYLELTRSLSSFWISQGFVSKLKITESSIYLDFTRFR